MNNRFDQITRSYTRAYVSQHYEAWDKRIFQNYDIDAYLKEMDQLDPEVVIVTARSHNGYWFCDVNRGQQHPGLKGVNQLQACIDYFHAKNKPVVAYFSAVYDKEFAEMHPSWRQMGPEGLSVTTGSYGNNVCLNSPYRDHLKDMITQLVKTHDIDGILFDMTFFEGHECYCESCRRLFKAEYNAELPAQRDWSNPMYLNFVKFRQSSNFSFVKDIVDSAKCINPDLAVYVQYLLMKNNDNMTQTIEMAKYADYIYADIYFSNGFLQISEITKVSSQITKHRPEIGFMTRPGNHNDTPNSMPLAHLQHATALAIANGGAVHFFDIMWPDGTLQHSNWDRNRQIFEGIKARREWLGGSDLANTAVFYSENSRFWYGKEDPFNKWDACFLGIGRALIEEHIPHNCIVELTEESLKPYDTLILPNAACMSQSEIEAVRQFVFNGGGLICTGLTSLFDEKGNRRNDYGLADVLGANWRGTTAKYSRVFSRFCAGHLISSRLPEDGLMSSWGELQLVTPDTANVLATVNYPLTEPTGTRFVNTMANPPAVDTNDPACTENQFGRGKVIYFAGFPDKDYLSLSFLELRWMLCDALRYVSTKPFFAEIKHPAPVEMTAFEQAEKNRWIIHLVNTQCEYGKTFFRKGSDLFASGSKDDALPPFATRNLIQAVYPAHDITLSIHSEREIRSAVLEPSGQILEYTQNGADAVVHVPEIDFHQMVVLQF